MGIEPLHREKITFNNNALEEVKISCGTRYILKLVSL